MDSSGVKQVSLEAVMPLIREQLAAGQTVSLSPKGTSMLPMLRQGIDAVTLSPLPGQLRKYDIPLYRRENGQYVLHRIVRCGETYTCIGDNQFRPETGVRREQMIAVVTAFTRNGRQWSVSSLPYQVYCRLWHWTRPVRWIWRSVGNRLR